ncbi:helix-turn-helix domain-containing protein [Clavibacter michiganensis subsp. phaseoli]|uniref:Helix-turn-helix domain-containing protein n=1 Tax=Clavibacter phaseoli TaxID=1734031 RepID=A0A8I0S7B5_9MICO|nr:helix-turn-helix domain-containing protein [Clavibacter phaseoli]
MSNRTVDALRIVRHITERPDPVDAIPLGAIARATATSPSSASRLCAELARSGMLARGSDYGSYSLGPRAIHLSGTAFTPHAHTQRVALTLAAQQTGETVLLAAPDGAGRLRIVDHITSGWTLHAPAKLGEAIEDPDSASAAAIAIAAGDEADPALTESTSGRRTELATVVRAPDGSPMGVLAVRLPTTRAVRNGPRARRALGAARRTLESNFHTNEMPTPAHRIEPAARATEHTRTTIEAISSLLEEAAAHPDTTAGLARRTGLHPDRARRILQACASEGITSVAPDTGVHTITWVVQGWHRARRIPTITVAGSRLVAAIADDLDISAFITTLSGMRSHTLVEELRGVGEGLAMTSWLGRAHPLIGSDGGPTMLVDFGDAEIHQLFPNRHTPQELMRFTALVRRARRDHVLTMQAYDDPSVIAVSAPIRDSSGSVVAAACLVGSTYDIRSRSRDIEDAAQRLGQDVTTALTRRS